MFSRSIARSLATALFVLGALFGVVPAAALAAVTSLSAGPGIKLSPNPITSTGTVSIMVPWVFSTSLTHPLVALYNTGGSGASYAIKGTGSTGLVGTSSRAGGYGVEGYGGSPGGWGVVGFGTSARGGVYAQGGPSNGLGIQAVGSGVGVGVKASGGSGGGAGVAASGGSNGIGVAATGGNNAAGVDANGSGTGDGVIAHGGEGGSGGGDGGNGLTATGGFPDPNGPGGNTGTGVQANGGNGVGLTSGGAGVVAQGGAGGGASAFPGGAGIVASGGSDGMGGTALAGLFQGDISVTGAITAGTKDFKIDDPLDPAHKYLVHTSVESPVAENVYNGNVSTDSQGYATVDLPPYFDAENTDPRYQLTVIGSFAQAVVWKQESANQFQIRSNRPHVQVSWQITGIRNDAYARSVRAPAEQPKTGKEYGRYLQPAAYGAANNQSIAALYFPTRQPSPHKH